MKKNATLSQKALFVWQHHKPLLIGIVTVLFVAALSLLGQSNWYKSSLLEVSNPFDGTIYPIEKSPNYLTWKGNVKVNTYDEVPASDLIELPDYNLALKSGDSDAIKNAKLTYPVVYLGNYAGDFKEEKGSHVGLDIRVPQGTPVKNIAHGVVVKVQRSSIGFGNHLCVRHKNVPNESGSGTTSLLSCYNHLSEIFVEEGAFAFKGDIIAKSGNTGTSTTPHLHFQIDTEDAPWHPYWPFSSADVAAANLTWFGAVTAGLNLDIAKNMGINPMKWIARNYSEEGIGGSLVVSNDDTNTNNNQNSSDEDDLTGVLAAFSISVDDANFTVGDDVTLVVTAQDVYGNTVKDFKPSSEFQVASSSGTAEYSQSLRFLNGQSRLVVSNTEAGDFEITLKEGDVTASTLLIAEAEEVIVVEDDSQEETLHGSADDEETDTGVEEQTPNTNNEQVDTVIADVKFSGDEAFLVGNSVYVYVEFFDEDNNRLDTIPEVEVKVDGKGELDKDSLNSDDISNGKAIVRYSSDEAEIARISIEGETYEVEAIDQSAPAATMSAFTLETADKLVFNTPTKVIVQAIDADGNNVPNYSALGNVNFSFTQGSGSFDPEVLTLDDFKDGKAEVMVTVKNHDNERVTIKAQNGVYIGTEKFRITQSQEEIFSDVPNDHENAKAIRYLKDNDIIGGYADGSFKPNNEVSRIEAVKMLILGLNKGLSPSEQLQFPDTDNDQWYAPYVGRALYLEMVKGYPDGTFKPAGLVNRAEYYTILIRAAEGEQDATDEDVYEDVPAGAWFSGYVDYAKDNTITDAQTKFFPSGNVTRAEVAETLYRILQK